MGHGDIKKNGRFRLGHAAPGEIHLKHAAGQKEYKEGIIYWTKYQKMVSRVIREAEQVHGIIARGDKPQCPSWLQDRLYLVDPPHGPKFKLNNSGKWHASYDAAIESGWLDKMSEVYSGYRPKWGGKIEFYKNFEQAIYYVSDCMTFWDSDAIIASAANEIISEKQIDDFILSRLHFYQSPEFIERISGKGNPALQLVALSAHFHDGVVHLHPAYLISMPLLFKRSWGEYVTKSFAPKGGRRSKGSGWSGGERLGKIGQTGKLIIEAAGPALAGAVAVRTAGLSSDYKLNPTWNKLHFVLEDRAYIKSDKIDELISKASDRCYDLFCAKEMIEELNRIGLRNPAFEKKRKFYLEQAQKRAHEIEQALYKSLLGQRVADIEKRESLLSRLRAEVEQELTYARESSEKAKTIETGTAKRASALEKREQDQMNRELKFAQNIKENLASAVSQYRLLKRVQEAKEFDFELIRKGRFVCERAKLDDIQPEAVVFLGADFENYLKRILARGVSLVDPVDKREFDRLLAIRLGPKAESPKNGPNKDDKFK